ncbi:hypothetical protein GCM10027176_61640 [Actinoallomurus bryophytorum]|uniref:Uncharacterized protein n=1 Tax=Actinoallomurus bryophytorum TaxID=1490222 RepID=A0A543CV81_9ACTN|nr:hypothetical protein [Actinoallomurus bryophytorum]TQM01016.1 hypothetical protein FB559_6759 [Actinoallomurus bryophytorum]
MNAAQRLIRLYPGPFRERWGPAMEIEVQSTGWRSWPDLAVGIAGMWLHPVIWPADSTAQRQRRAAVMAVTVAAACWYLAHVAMEMDTPLSGRVARAWPMTACTGLMFLGFLLVLPRPRLTLDAASTVLRGAARRFATPVILGAAVVACVRTGTYTVAPALLRPVLLGCWWTALALGAFHGCRIVASLGAGVAVAPRPARLRLGMWTLALAGTAAGSMLLSVSVTGGHLDLWSAAPGIGLLVLPSAFAGTLRDLRRVVAEPAGL